MGLRTIYRMAENKSAPFCRCDQRRPGIPSSSTSSSQLNKKCECGEFDCQRIDWTWSASNCCNDDDTVDEDEFEGGEGAGGLASSSKQISLDGTNVLFHPVYSQGTAVVRSATPLGRQNIHYWEVKITSCMSGTDTMIGIGTDRVNLNSHHYKFSSFLGLDDQSWGYSYRGLVQHQGRMKYYGKKFSAGCIVGVYVDTFKGHLEFYINRRSQGIAYRNLPIAVGDPPLYPMICSTAAKSSVKLINTSATQESLQFQCMKVIGRYPELVQKVQQIPGLRMLCRDTWFLQCKEQYRYSEFHENNLLLLEDDAIVCGLEGKKKRRRHEPIAACTDTDVHHEADIYKDLVTDAKAATLLTSSDDDDDNEGNDGASGSGDPTINMIHGVHFLL